MNDIACVQQLTTLEKEKKTGKSKISLTMFLDSLLFELDNNSGDQIT